MHAPLLESDFESVIVREELVEGLCDVAGPVGKGPCKSFRGILLIAIHKAFQLQTVVAHIGDIEQRVLCQLSLYAEEIVLDIAVSAVLRNPRNIVGRRIEGGHQSRWEALARSGIAAR